MRTLSKHWKRNALGNLERGDLLILRARNQRHLYRGTTLLGSFTKLITAKAYADSLPS